MTAPRRDDGAAGRWNPRRRTLITAASAALVARTFAQSAATMVPRAFLVGNSSYRPSSQNILTAGKNLRDLEDALKQLGYRVDSVLDASKAQVLGGVDAMLAGAAPEQPVFIYFCGHGVNSLSRGEYHNYWVAADLDLTLPAAAAQDAAARAKHYDAIAQLSASLEDDIYPRLASRTRGVTFVVIDACRDAASDISDLNNRVTQSRPPAGCLVGYATRPGRYAYTPRDANQNSYFAESLVRQLRAVTDEGDMTQLLQRVRLEVREKVNNIAREEGALDRMLSRLGLKDGFLQEPDVASSVTGRATLRPPAEPIARVLPEPQPAQDAQPPRPPEPPPETDVMVWARVEAISDLGDAEKAVADFLRRFPSSPLSANATIRLEDIRRVREAARRSRVMRSPLNIPESGPLANDYRAALQGDKFAAQRVSETITRTPALGDAALAMRWLQFAAELGNGIAAYEVSQAFNIRNLVQEASYYLALARANGYRPPRDFDTQK